MFARALRRRFALATRRLPVLGIRDFRLLLADRVLAPASFAFSLVGVSFAVLNATHGSTAKLSYVLAAQIAPSLIFLLLGGVIADRIAPQKVIIAGNVMMAIGEGTFGILVLAGHPALWQMIALEGLTGTGMAIFYPASSALLPRLVPGELLQEASALSRLAMNGAQMGGAVLAGFVVAAVGPGWALAICGAGLLGTLPLMLALRVTAHERTQQPGMLRELREGWSEFRSHTWLWVIVAPVRRRTGGLVRRVRGPRPGCRPRASGRGSGLGHHHRCRVAGPDHGRADLTALQPATADALRGRDRREHRHLAAGAGDAVASAGDLPGLLRPRHRHGDHDGAVDRGAGPEHPGGEAGQGLVLRRVRFCHGHAGRRRPRRADRGLGRCLRYPVRGCRADRGGVAARAHSA